MKKIFFLLSACAALLAALPASAQEEVVTVIEPGPTESTAQMIVRRVGFGNTEETTYSSYEEYADAPSRHVFPKRWKWHGGHWAGFGIGYNGLVKNLGHMSLPEGSKFLRQSAKSIGVNINFADFVIVSNRHFGLITGLGLEINNFRFDDNIGLTRNEAGYIVPDYSFTEAGYGIEKSKLTTTYLNIPLLAEFQFGRSRKKSGFVNFGVVAGVRLGGHTKVKASGPEWRGTLKQHEGLNLRNFHYGFELNVGYKHYGLFAKYYPQSIFKADQGPNVQQTNIGLALYF